MRHTLWAFVLAVGCYGESITPPDYPVEEPGPEGTDLQVDQNDLRFPLTSELGTEITRPIAKTIEWPGISTEEGTTFADGKVVVDQIMRDDSQDGTYGVRVRLKNTTKEAQRLEYVIRFYTREGHRIAGYQGVAGTQERWKGFVINPFRYTVVDDFARVHGAEGFRLHVRAAGAGGENK